MAWGANFNKAVNEFGRQVEVSPDDCESYVIVKLKPF
jgi:hypothetical protein